MKQMNKNEVYVARRIGNKERKVPLHELPKIAQRVRDVEQRYGIRVIQCTYEPNRGNLLTMKYTKRSDGESTSAAA